MKHNPNPHEATVLMLIWVSIKWLCYALVYAYRLLLSPLLGPKCRFAPSCSEYALEALEKHRLSRALRLILRRLLRCHPWGGHGFDPVPRTPKKAPIK